METHRLRLVSVSWREEETPLLLSTRCLADAWRFRDDSILTVGRRFVDCDHLLACAYLRPKQLACHAPSIVEARFDSTPPSSFALQGSLTPSLHGTSRHRCDAADHHGPATRCEHTCGWHIHFGFGTMGAACFPSCADALWSASSHLKAVLLLCRHSPALHQN